MSLGGSLVKVSMKAKRLPFMIESGATWPVNSFSFGL